MSSRPPGPSGGHSAGESSGVRGGAGAGGAEESTARLGGCPEPACFSGAGAGCRNSFAVRKTNKQTNINDACVSSGLCGPAPRGPHSRRGVCSRPSLEPGLSRQVGDSWEGCGSEPPRRMTTNRWLQTTETIFSLFRKLEGQNPGVVGPPSPQRPQGRVLPPCPASQGSRSPPPCGRTAPSSASSSQGLFLLPYHLPLPASYRDTCRWTRAQSRMTSSRGPYLSHLCKDAFSK